MKVAVILGSTREGRLGERVAKLVMSRLALIEGTEAELLDLKDYPMPFYEESESPSSIKTPYKSEAANRWAAKIGEADAFVIVTPEYNHGYPAVLKNALDYVYFQWNDKPVSFVSYSNGIIGGARSVEQLKPVVAHLKLVILQEALHIGKAQDAIDPEGRVLSGPLDAILDKQLAATIEWGRFLQPKRAPKN